MTNRILFGVFLLILFLFTPTSYATEYSLLETLTNKSKEISYFKANIKTPDLHDVECLAFMIYGESRGESYQGQLAVAFVAYNRMKKYNKSYCQIIKQSNQFHFNTPFPKREEEKEKWKKILNLSFHLILEEGFSNIESPIDGALYFRNSSGNKFPGKKFIKTIGNHHFYN